MPRISSNGVNRKFSEMKCAAEYWVTFRRTDWIEIDIKLRTPTTILGSDFLMRLHWNINLEGGCRPPFHILLNEHKLFWDTTFSKFSQLCLREVKTFLSVHLYLQSFDLAKILKCIQTLTGTSFIVRICFNAYGKSTNILINNKCLFIYPFWNKWVTFCRPGLVETV